MDMIAAVLAGSMAVSAAAPAQGPSAQPRPPVDALRGCLADSTSGRDRKDLAKWIFLAMAAHPEMKQHAGAGTAAAGVESSKAVAALVTRLLTDACAKEAKAVMATGDAGTAMRLAFEGLGQLAMAELMTDKAVEEAMGGFAKYLDRERFTEALTPK
jgi:hypothetical protein